MTGLSSPGNGRLLDDVVGIGLLTRAYNRGLVESVLMETGAREKRVRLLPAHVTVYLVMGMTLHMDESYDQVIRRFANGMAQIRGDLPEFPIPTVGAITAARTRLGWRPLEALFHRAALPLAQPKTPGAFLAGRRVFALRSTIVNVPDSPANAAAFGYHTTDTKPFRTAFPQVRSLRLAEPGSLATIGAAFGPQSQDIRELAAELFAGHLRPGVILAAGPQFYSPRLWASARAQGADLLWAVVDEVELLVHAALPDGTYLAELPRPDSPDPEPASPEPESQEGGGPGVRPLVRVLACQQTFPDGSSTMFRLISSILSPEDSSGPELASVYSAAMRSTCALDDLDAQAFPDTLVIRSRRPDLVRQEMWAHLLTEYAIRAFVNRSSPDVGALITQVSPAEPITLAPSRRE